MMSSVLKKADKLNLSLSLSLFCFSPMKEMYGEMIFLKALLIKNYHLQVHILPL